VGHPGAVTDRPSSRARVTAAAFDPAPASTAGLGGDVATVLEQLLARGRQLVDLQARQQILLDAIISIGSDLSLADVLSRIVTSGTRLVDARYGALGVVDRDGRLTDFVHTGFTDTQIAEVGAPPAGKGLLGLLIADPRPLRLDTIAGHRPSVGFPPGHPPMAAFLGVPIRAGNRVFGNLYLAEKTTAAVFSEVDERLVTALAAAAGIAIENARLFEESLAQQRWSAAAAEVSAVVLGADHSVDPAATIAAAVRAAGPFTAVSVSLDRDSAPAVSGSADDASWLAERRVRTAVGHAAGPGAAPTAATVDRSDRQAHSWPLTGPSGHLGLIEALDPPATPDVAPAVDAFIVAFAAGAAQALELARAQDDRERLTLLEDRDRIARDLHDLVIQRLFATGLSVESLRVRAADPDTAARLDRAVLDLDDTISQIRRTIFSLRDTSPAGVRSLVTAIVDAAAAQPGPRPVLRIVGPVDAAVPPDLHTDIEAVLTEVLSNAGRHAPGAARWVDVRVTADTLTLVVTDDGPGLGSSTRRCGLANLADRAQRRGGTCTVDGGRAGGTRVSWSVPLSPPAAVVAPDRLAS